MKKKYSIIIEDITKRTPLLLIFLMYFIQLSAFCEQKQIDYYELAKTGTVSEIRSAFRQKSSLQNAVFGENEETFLMLCLKENRELDVINLLLSYECDVLATAKDGRTPLMFAAQYSSNKTVIEKIIRHGTVFNWGTKSRVSAVDNNGKTTFDYALLNKTSGIIEILEQYAPRPVPSQSTVAEVEETTTETLPSEADLQTPPLEEETEEKQDVELQEALAVEEVPDFTTEQKEEISYLPLIENPNKKDKNGVLPLIRAIQEGNDWEVEQLIRSGADVNAVDEKKWTPLMYAIRYQNSLSLVELLIKNGANTQIKDSYNVSPLLLAAEYSKNPDIVALLLKGKSGSEQDVMQAFIMCLSSTFDTEYIIEGKVTRFLQANVPINRLWKGKTPLIYACSLGSSSKVIKLLLDYGANPSVKDSNGKTAFDYAKENPSLAHDDTYWLLNQR